MLFITLRPPVIIKWCISKFVLVISTCVKVKVLFCVFSLLVNTPPFFWQTQQTLIGGAPIKGNVLSTDWWKSLYCTVFHQCSVVAVRIVFSIWYASLNRICGYLITGTDTRDLNLIRFIPIYWLATNCHFPLCDWTVVSRWHVHFLFYEKLVNCYFENDLYNLMFLFSSSFFNRNFPPFYYLFLINADLAKFLSSRRRVMTIFPWLYFVLKRATHFQQRLRIF